MTYIFWQNPYLFIPKTSPNKVKSVELITPTFSFHLLTSHVALAPFFRLLLRRVILLFYPSARFFFSCTHGNRDARIM